MTLNVPTTPQSGPTLWTPAPPTVIPVGSLIDWPGPAKRIPATFLETYGQSLLRLTFNALFNALNYQIGSASVTAASPAVFTSSSHGLVIGDPVYFQTVNTVTGLTANLTYYVMTVPTANTFTVGTTRSFTATTGAAVVTTAVNTSGSAGTVDLWYSPYGVADSTHFYVPDLRGRGAIGMDNMGGSDAGRIGWDNVQGAGAGEATHTQLVAELATHTHTWTYANAGGGSATGNVVPPWNPFAAGSGAADNTGSSTPFNVMQPSLAVRKLIYAGVDA